MAQRHPIQNEQTMLVTAVTLDRKPLFLNPAFAREAIERLYRVQQLHPFLLYAFVVMPDHVHFLMRLLAPEKISNVMATYKSGLAHDVGIGPFWQRRFHIRTIENALAAKEYVHQNPVRRGFVEIASDYPWSSAFGRWDISPLDELHVS